MQPCFLKQIFKQLIAVVIFGSILLPSFVFAQTGSLQVNQPVGSGSGGGGGGGAPPDTTAPQIFDVAVKATYNSAIVSWSTNEIGLGKVAWGKNQDYGDGEITVEKYLTNHQSQILQLAPQTQFYFRITSIDQAGNTRVYTGKFLTLAEPDTTGPQNVANFAVQPMRDRMILSWSNPVDIDFAGVRIVRSDRFYPLDYLNGEVVYEGTQAFIWDMTVVPGRTYYYTIFAKDNSGNYSTGVVGTGVILWYSESSSQPPDAPVVDIQFPQAPGEVQNPASFNDFTIIYNNGAATGNNNNLQLPVGEDIKIVVPQSALPVGADSLIVTVRDQTNNTGQSTYLFSYDKLTKEFFTTIPALISQQTYELVITIFNGAQQILQIIEGSLEIIRSAGEVVVKTVSEMPAQGVRIGIAIGVGTLLAALVIYQLFFAGTQIGITATASTAAAGMGASGSSTATTSARAPRTRTSRRKPAVKSKLKSK